LAQGFLIWEGGVKASLEIGVKGTGTNYYYLEPLAKGRLFGRKLRVFFQKGRKVWKLKFREGIRRTNFH